jgi:non-heme chloroperoxidase
MSTRNSWDRRTLLLVCTLVSMACTDSQVIAAQLEKPLLDLKTDSIVGGGGVRLTAYEAGIVGARPIVFIHGFSGNHLSWDRMFSGTLASEFHLVTYDLRGHGASDKPLDAANYTNGEMWADDLAAVIQAKNLVKPVLVGWSYGAYVIADYIRKFGDGNLGGVVFLGASTKLGTAQAVEFLTPEVLAVFPDLLSAEVRKSIDATRTLTRMFANPLSDAPWEIAYGGAMMVPPQVRVGMFSRALENDDVLAKIRVPTLAIHGTIDRIVRVIAARHTVRTVPNAKLRLYEGIGHAPNLESPERLGNDLAEFVRSAHSARNVSAGRLGSARHTGPSIHGAQIATMPQP